MAFHLRMVLAVCLALVLVVSPFGAANAGDCAAAGHMERDAATASPSAGIHHHGSDRDGSAGQGPAAHGAILHACCLGMCFGPAVSAMEIAPVVLGAVAVAWPADTALPEGLSTAPPLGPPRSTI